jgi:prophage regulatory protein
MPAVFCSALRPFFDAPGHDITAKNSTVWRSIMSPANHKSKASIKTNEVDRLDVVAGVAVDRLLRLPQVLQLVPVSRSTWFSGVRSGRYPAPVRVGLRAVAWRQRDLQQILQTGIPISKNGLAD